MLNLRIRNTHDAVPECLRKADLVIADLETLVEDFPLPERSVSRELTDYFLWKYDRNLIFDPLYGDIQKLSNYASGGLLGEAQDILRAWEARCVARASPRQRMVELIRRIRDQGVFVAVTSERMQQTATRLLRSFGLTISVDMVVGGDDVFHPRPHPEPLELVLNATGFRTDEAVFVGSRRSDVEMGRRVGIAT
ncbi:MAG: HAD hydrolase-like protein [Gammaproteobacteria bacterium]|jgi:pyrophosphatase PpaX|nr:HAD hydrolase-like protein [Gammaproteobacteria bacterium]